MNKTTIKNFAIWARRELIEKVTKKAKIYGIEKDKEMKEMDTALNGQVLTSDDKKARRILIEKIDKDGFDETIEEVAYTWFNRFIAIRFMEVNGYIPSHIRVFTSENNEFEPQILSEAIHIDLPGLDKSKVLELYNAGNKEEELFNYLFITQCNALNEVLPGMFQKLNDYTELLLPDGLLRDDSVIDVMISEIPEEDWKEQVQIIGWLYQYYNTEPKDEVFKKFGDKNKVNTKEDIPAATQLFTPDWIVRYMVENSLGRLWIEGHPDEELKENWKYYIEDAKQEVEIEEKLQKIKKEYADIKPQDIKCIDPCIGSGHIGCYLFDVLIQIYESCGYKRRDAVKLILENNIYGLDIDERARQLAYFSLMMKARQYDRRFLSRKDIPQPKVYAIEESNFFKTENGKNIIEYFSNGDNDLKKDIDSIIEDMMDAKEYGSIINVNQVNFEALYNRFEDIKKEFTMNLDGVLALEQLLPLVEQAEVLSDKYDVVVTNPPYLKADNIPTKLADYIYKKNTYAKYDLYAAFIYKSYSYLKQNGILGMITMHNFMYAPSFLNMRNEIKHWDWISLLHLGSRAFSEISGEVVQTAAYVISKTNIKRKMKVVDVTKFNDSDLKEKEFLNRNCEIYSFDISKIDIIPGNAFGYDLSDTILDLYKEKLFLGDYGISKAGIVTGKDSYFIKFWHEVNYNDITFNPNYNDISYKYVLFSKGGTFNKWYGNTQNVLKLSDLWDDTKTNKSVRRGDIDVYYKKGIGWSQMGGGVNKSYSQIENAVCKTTTPMLYPNKKYFEYILGYLNSNIPPRVLKSLNPTLSILTSDIMNLPIIYDEQYAEEIKKIVEKSIEISKLLYSQKEENYQFLKNPLLLYGKGRISDSLNKYCEKVYKLEKEMFIYQKRLNEIFSNIFSIKNVQTINFESSIDKKNEIIRFMSYFVGCCMGRYSLDEEGLVFAGGEFDSSKYTSFRAVEDGILPITDQEYFEDDIVELFVEFLKITFGEEHLNENLDFIASELKGKKSDSSRERIRNYFLNDFYKDHCKMYQKLPIYWQYDSGKNDACRGLFYLHRYDKDMFARIRINYVFEVQDRYKQELVRVEDTIAESSGNKKIELQKRADALKKKIIESQQFEEKVQHIADSYIEIDLDDGVKENYKIFKDVLAKIK
ncbi:BREX-1 system adenine-specific DNA-methyltransferase PglX [Anaerosalibacter sp. Marseille-P3206]|uniref:BREX-1 system adenine-specific DNA-methyltransferase PglX n=1 Tax=Anaerosalibacter sp. Marseille-P3206 TaxID=1871005 RepID=UPI0009842FD3|nr:BREX-1 system adenine-specific DNA-methyltransferase PglX [Anaerosalibacter sp. Marseille-P3206]